MNFKGFASIEAFLSLLFAAGAFALLMPLFSPPSNNSLSALYVFQLSQDLMEISVHNSQILDNIISFSKGEPAAKSFLEEKYAGMLEQLGDYCIGLEAGEQKLETGCREGIKTKTSASRTIFDPETGEFFEATITLGIYS